MAERTDSFSTVRPGQAPAWLRRIHELPATESAVVYCPARKRAVVLEECRNCGACRGLFVDTADQTSFLRCAFGVQAEEQAPGDTYSGPSIGELPVRLVMRAPVQFAMTNWSLPRLAKLFVEAHISAAPVLDPCGSVVGLVSKTDLMSHVAGQIDEAELAQEAESARAYGPEEPAGAYCEVRPAGANASAEPAGAFSDAEPTEAEIAASERDLAAEDPDATLGPAPEARQEAAALTHPPAGSLCVSDVMTPMVLGVPEDTEVGRAAALMAFEGVHHVLVWDAEGGVAGIVSALDLLHRIAQDGGYAAPQLDEGDADGGQDPEEEVEQAPEEGKAPQEPK